MNALIKAKPKTTLRIEHKDASGKLLYSGYVSPKWRAYINPKYWWYKFVTRNRK